MSKPRTFQAKMYSLQPLDDSLRVDFRLEAYPIESDGITLSPVVKPFFEKHSIIYYRDEISPFGVLCQPLDEDSTPLYRRGGFVAYVSHVLLLWEGMTPSRWSPQSDPIHYRKIVEKWKDDYAWLRYNKTEVILQMNEKYVQLG